MIQDNAKRSEARASIAREVRRNRNPKAESGLSGIIVIALALGLCYLVGTLILAALRVLGIDLL